MLNRRRARARPARSVRRWSGSGAGLPGGLATLVLAVLLAACDRSPAASDAGAGPDAEAVAAPALRLTGTVEAVQTTAVSVPRLQGPFAPLLVVGLVEAGTRVEQGDLLVEFDPQQQERNAFDRRAELINATSEIEKKIAEQTALEAKDRTELAAAEHDVARAELEVRKNDLIAAIDAEKNTLALEQARARFAQLEKTFALKREAAAADLRILEIRRERAERALSYAEGNAELMRVRAPFGGLVVIKRTYRNGQFVEVARGDELRPGTAIIDIVDTSAMRVRAKVNQADALAVRTGQPVRVGLDGFPALVFDGTVESVTPMAVASRLSDQVRTLTALVTIHGSDPQLLPDLTAWVDVPVSSGDVTARFR